MGGIVEDGAHDGLIGGHQCFGREAPARPSYGFCDIEGPRCPLDTVAGAEGEVGDTQDFSGYVQRSHCVADSHMRVESGLVGIGCEQGHAGFLGGSLYAGSTSRNLERNILP